MSANQSGFAGASSEVDTNPEHLATLKSTRERRESSGVFTIKTWPSQTYFDLAHPRPEDVRLVDIAHSLSMQCRYAGHVPQFYSVAQHCCIVAELAPAFGVPSELVGHALLHDAHECFNQDIVSPNKKLLGRQYANTSADIQAAILKALGLKQVSSEHRMAIKSADEAAATMEQLARNRGDMVIDAVEFRRAPWSSDKAFAQFKLACFLFIDRSDGMASAWEGFDSA